MGLKLVKSVKKQSVADQVVQNRYYYSGTSQTMEGNVSTFKMNFSRRGIQHGNNEKLYVLIHFIHDSGVLND